MNNYHKILTIPILLWIRLNNNLRKQGNGERESGAFLLGSLTESKVINFICYIELDKNSLDDRSIHFRSQYYTKLWDICNQRKLQVLADVHTHPSSNTNQSLIDKTHPMIIQNEHIALIIPHYAKKKFPSLKGVGIYEYKGDLVWEKYSSESNRVVLTIF
jgi:proteasome lid subunit RPN8/RPN11